MKITLVESEIREAIQAYVLGHFNIKEGMQISMEFTATRGSDGLTASIDISKVADGVQSGPMTQAASVVAVPVPAAPVPAPVPAPKPPVAAPVAAPVVVPVPDPVLPEETEKVTPISQADVVEQTTDDPPAPAAPVTTAPVATPPTVTRRTLFSSLPAPSNKTAPATVS